MIPSDLESFQKFIENLKKGLDHKKLAENRKTVF